MEAVTLLSHDPVQAAREMLGWRLVSRIGGSITAGMIVETEAYRALDDPACHGYRNRTKRNAPIWEDAGTLYVYLSYGLHHLLNIVTGPKDTGWVVLIRALEPLEGLPLMMQRRYIDKPQLLTNGPGRLTQALGISLLETGTALGDTIRLEPPTHRINETDITISKRIGISQGRDLPWRFYITDNPFVSKR